MNRTFPSPLLCWNPSSTCLLEGSVMPECLNSMSSNQAKSSTGHLWPDGSVFDLVRERISAKQEKEKQTQNRRTRKKASRKKIETSLTREKNSVWEERTSPEAQGSKSLSRCSIWCQWRSHQDHGTSFAQFGGWYVSEAGPFPICQHRKLQGSCPQMDTQGSGPMSPDRQTPLSWNPKLQSAAAMWLSNNGCCSQCHYPHSCPRQTQPGARLTLVPCGWVIIVLCKPCLAMNQSSNNVHN